MNTSSWDPQSGQQETVVEVSEVQLLRFAQLAAEGQLENLKAELSSDEISMGPLMRWTDEQWLPWLGKLNHDTLLDLIRFFTCAEMQLDGWNAGEQSPVIKITRRLKASGHRLDKELLLWIRQNSSNRYLPNGAVL